MDNDIVTQLREKYAGQLPICLEAADEIERLRKYIGLLSLTVELQTNELKELKNG